MNGVSREGVKRQKLAYAGRQRPSISMLPSSIRGRPPYPCTTRCAIFRLNACFQAMA